MSFRVPKLSLVRPIGCANSPPINYLSPPPPSQNQSPSAQHFGGGGAKGEKKYSASAIIFFHGTLLTARTLISCRKK